MNNVFVLFLISSIVATGMSYPLSFADEHSANSTSGSNSTITINDEIMMEDKTDDVESGNNIEIEDTLETGDSMQNEDETNDDLFPIVISPLKQIKDGIAPENVVCKEGLELVFKINGQPACVKTTSIQKLTTWGWIQ